MVKFILFFERPTMRVITGISVSILQLLCRSTVPFKLNINEDIAVAILHFRSTSMDEFCFARVIVRVTDTVFITVRYIFMYIK